MASALTSGARRGLLNLPVDEEVGLVGLHWGDQFHEFVPWKGDVQWEVTPWGSWKVAANNETHKVLVEATCDRPRGAASRSNSKQWPGTFVQRLILWQGMALCRSLLANFYFLAPVARSSTKVVPCICIEGSYVAHATY